MRMYELMVIHRPGLSDTEMRSAVAEIETGLQAQGAEMKGSDLWGKRRFAYEIDHIKEGYYSVLTFGGEPEVVEILDRALALSEPVIRHKFVRLEHMEKVS
ncbi:MAG: 30S ribosomal protein S6 [Acidimicrobiia bacterium]|nr:30S ribosomal protein S6 [Acidimicrobiia bacterium]